MYRESLAQGIERMGRLADTIGKLGRLPRIVAEIAQPGIQRELDKEFLEGRDPYGEPWAPLAPATVARGRHPPPLWHRGHLHRATRAELLAGARPGLWLTIKSAQYGYFHQVGTRHMPKREILPTRGIPGRWYRGVLVEASKRAFKSVWERFR